MLRKELSIVVALVIAIAIPVVPFNNVDLGGGFMGNRSGHFKDLNHTLLAKSLGLVTLLAKSLGLVERVVRQLQNEQIQSYTLTGQESCANLYDREVMRQVGSCVRGVLFTSESQLDRSPAEEFDKAYELGCKNYRQNIRACFHPYIIKFKNCLSVEEDSVKAATDGIVDFMCSGPSVGIALDDLFDSSEEECLHSYGEDLLKCTYESKAKDTTIISLISNQEDFCGTLNKGQLCSSQWRPDECNREILGALIKKTLKSVSTARCSSRPGSRNTRGGTEHIATSLTFVLAGILMTGLFTSY